MGRAATKTDLMQSAGEQFEKLWNLMDSLTEDERNTPLNFSGLNKSEAHWERDKNLRDVLVHLYEWHQLLLNWIGSNLSGNAAPFLPAPYNWKTCGQMNTAFWNKHQTTSYEEAKHLLLESHQKVMDRIESFSNDELFEKKHFSWTGNSTLGSYCVSVTSSHYDWAMKKIKAHRKICKEAAEG